MKNVNNNKYIAVKNINIQPDLVIQCPKCGKMLFKGDMDKGDKICPECSYYMKMSARERLFSTVDQGSFEEYFREKEVKNPLDFPEYENKQIELRNKTRLDEAVVCGIAKIGGHKIVIAVMDTNFMMGSMGSTVGEKITKSVELSIKKKLPLVIFTASGGARMQEGMFSLMQMAKTSQAIAKHSEKGLLYIAVLTDPTTGGVSASFANLGDVIIAEKNALIGFAGPRVIKQVTGRELPSGFQRAEFLLDHGLVDMVVDRRNMRSVLINILSIHAPHKKVKYRDRQASSIVPKMIEINSNQSGLKAMDIVFKSREPTRSKARDYIDFLCDRFVEFSGDRLFGEDETIVCGIGEIDQRPVFVVGQQKDKNFGMPNPEGYRKVLRLLDYAEKFRLPVVSFVDTPGAGCGIEAEERGQSIAIANCIARFSRLNVPTVSVVIGEGGSGGALAISVTDEIWMLENSVYSILSPEGFSSILWKDPSKKYEAAELMKLTSWDMKNKGFIEKIIPEDGNQMPYLKMELCDFLDKYQSVSIDRVVKKRNKKYRSVIC